MANGVDRTGASARSVRKSCCSYTRKRPPHGPRSHSLYRDIRRRITRNRCCGRRRPYARCFDRLAPSRKCEDGEFFPRWDPDETIGSKRDPNPAIDPFLRVAGGPNQNQLRNGSPILLIRTRPLAAEIRSTSISDKPVKPASKAERISTSGAARLKPRRTRASRSSSAWNLTRMARTLEFGDQIRVRASRFGLLRIGSVLAVCQVGVDFCLVR